MNEFAKQVQTSWGRLGGFQRFMFVAVGLACVGVFVGLLCWVRTPRMQLLYGGLSAEEASQVAQKVGEMGSKYEVRDGGSSIYVSEERVHELRLALAGEGLPKSTHVGYSLFDEDKVTASPFVLEVNLGRALEGELAQTIELLDAVVYARVHIVRQDRAIFASEAIRSGATVALKLRPGARLGPSKVAAITHLVAGAVKGLSAGEVVVVDSGGTLLTGEEGGELSMKTTLALDYKTQVEEYLSSKVEGMLTAALGPNRAVVKVDAEVDLENSDLTTETYLPDGRVAQVEDILDKSSSSPEVGGTPGEAPGSSGGNKTTESKIRTEYLVSKTIERKSDLPGTIKSLSIAAFVDLSAPEEAGAGTEGAEGGSAASAGAGMLAIADVEEIIKQAVGFREDRGGGTGDELKVVDVRFARSTATAGMDEAYEKARKREYYVGLARNGSLGALGIAGLLVMKMLLGRGRAPMEAVPALGAAPQVREQEERGLLRRQITRALRDNPDEVKKLFLTWVEESE